MAHLLTYEKICRALVKAARRAGLHAFGEEHILEFHTAGRSFEFFCVPKGYGPPYHRRARISFFWSPEQHVRVYSIEDDVEEVDSNDSIDEVADSDIEDREALDDRAEVRGAHRRDRAVRHWANRIARGGTSNADVRKYVGKLELLIEIFFESGRL